VREQAEPLQGARDAEAGELVRPDPAQRPALPGDLPGVRSDEAADDVEQRGLAGAVGPDEAEHLAVADVERHGVEGLEAAERDADVAHTEQRLAAARAGRGGAQVRRPLRCGRLPAGVHVDAATSRVLGRRYIWQSGSRELPG
jgi:hypothetical protein